MIQSGLDLPLLLAAFELLDERLLPGRDPNYRQVIERRFDHLADLGIRDEVTRVELLGQKIAERSLFERGKELAKAVFSMERGQPVLSDDLLAQRLARFLDPDLLTCLHPDFKPVLHGGCDWPATPALAACGFSTNLGPTVETHLHLGGALPPLYSWCLAMTGNFRFNRLTPSLIGSDLERTALWRDALHRAAWLRLALANRLRAFVTPDPFGHLKSPEKVHGYGAGLEALELGRMPEPFREIAFRFFTGKQAYQPDGPPFRDCLRPHYRQPDGHYAEGERRLLLGIVAKQAAFSEAPWADRLLHYVRIRNAFHRLLAFEEGDSGLFRFSESSRQRRSFAFYNHHNRRRREMRFERHRLATALDSQLRQPFERDAVLAGKHRLELRCSLGHRGTARNQLYAWVAGVQDFLHHLRGTSCPSMDANFKHFAEQHQAAYPWIEKLVERLRPPLVTCPVGIVLQLHKTANPLKDHNLQHVQIFASLAASFPKLRPLLIGVDTAGRERLVEPRRLSRAYRFLQAFEEQFRKGVADEFPIHWGYTYHVGEDTDDFLVGLRHVDEVVHLLLPLRGGRIGHGLILGEEPETYYRQRGLTRPTRRAYLLSLVWAWWVLQIEGFPGSAQRVYLFLVEQIPSLKDVDLHQCARNMMDAVAESWQPGLAVPQFSGSARIVKHAASEDQLLAMLTDAKGLDTRLTISPSKSDFALLREIQHCTQQRLLRRRLTIEVNPTSNLLIGNYANYRDLPYKAMSDAGLELSINTDDPGMFTTSLASEMTLLYQGLMAGGAKDPETRRWLDQLREHGIHSTFLPHPLQLQCDPELARQQRARLFSPS